MPNLEINRKSISNIQKVLFEIRSTLLQDEDIRKLLYYDTPDALEKAATPRPDQLINLNESIDYITLLPVMEKGVIDFHRNTYIMIYPTLMDLEIDQNKGSIFSGITVSVIVDKKCYFLNNDRIRALEIVERIISLIDNKKFSAAGKLEVLSGDPLIYNVPVYGYEVKCFISDQGEGNGF